MTRQLFLMLFLLLATAVWSAERLEVPIGDAPVRGPADAPVTIIEFIDFQ